MFDAAKHIHRRAFGALKFVVLTTMMMLFFWRSTQGEGTRCTLYTGNLTYTFSAGAGAAPWCG